MTKQEASFYIVTGGCGFIGANLVARLLEREPAAHVLVIDDMRSGSFETLVQRCDEVAGRAFTGDVIAERCGDVPLEEIVEQGPVSAVFHLAAITDTTVDDEAVMIHDNTAGFDALIAGCVGAGTPLVYASSAAVYGSPEEAERGEAFAEPSAGHPNNVYGFSKWLMENTHRRLTGGSDAHVVGLRFFNVFGPGEARKGTMASMAHRLAQQMLEGKNPRLFEPGDQKRDQVHVDDVVDCCLAAAKGGVHPGVYNCGSGQATAFNQVAQAVREGLGFSAEDRPIAHFEMPEHIRGFYQHFTQADMTAAKKGLKWEPKRDPVEALREYGRWMARQAGRVPAEAGA